MENTLDNHDAGHPAMKQVECVVADLEKRNEWIVAKCKQNRRNQIQGSEHTSAAAPLCVHGGALLITVIQDGAVREVHRHEDEEEERMESGGECAECDNRRQFNDLGMALRPERCIENVTLDPGPPFGLVRPPQCLLLAARACRM